MIYDTLLARKRGAELSADIGIARHPDWGEQRLSTSLISAPIPHSKSLFTCHSINKKVLSCFFFFENRSIVLQRAVFSLVSERVLCLHVSSWKSANLTVTG